MVSLSSISTTNKQLPNPVNHPFNAQLKLAYESFKSKGADIARKNGMMTVFEDAGLNNEYENVMFGDIANQDMQRNLVSIYENTMMGIENSDNGQITDESGSVANATTYAYLNGPVIRAVFARSIVPVMMKTVALKQTSYTATFDIPYIVKDGVRHDLPYELVAGADDEDYKEDLAGLTPLVPRAAAGEHINEDGSIKVDGKGGSGNLISESLTVTHTAYDDRHVDRRIFVRNVKYKVAAAADGSAEAGAAAAAGEEKTVAKTFAPSSKAGKAGDIIFIVELNDIPGLRTAAGESESYADATETGSEVLFVKIDLNTGAYSWSTTGAAITSFEFYAYLSPEDNRTPAVFKTEQHSLEVMIGAGQHIMVDTPVELLQEYPTSHQGSDYIISMTDIISQFYAGNMNLQMLRFFDDSFRSSQSTYIPETVLRGLNLSKKFDMRLSHGADPEAFINIHLKKCFAYYFNAIASYSRIQDGSWCVVGHANNVMQIPDFTVQGYTSINNDNDASREDVYGFKVGYTFGFATSATNGKIRCLYTPEIPMKKNLISVFTSNDEKRPTYIFHPFSYTISRGYNNPNNVVTPSIMVTKRHTFQEFVPMQLRLQLLGNDDSQFTNPMTIATPTPASYSPTNNSIY